MSGTARAELGNGGVIEVSRGGGGRQYSGPGNTGRMSFRYTAPGDDKSSRISGDTAYSLLQSHGAYVSHKFAKVEDASAKHRASLIVETISLDQLQDFIDNDATEELEDTFIDGSVDALVTVGVSNDDAITDVVNRRAVDAANEQAATLVTNIDASTRNMLRSAIADGLEENIGLDAIADGLVDDFAFSEDRADLIARTEISNANSQGALTGYKTARDEAGVKLFKEWLLGPNPCEICVANNDQGPIDLDDDFDSGDDAPPAHPNCECALSPVVEEEGD
jgi:hypothetical protein